MRDPLRKTQMWALSLVWMLIERLSGTWGKDGRIDPKEMACAYPKQSLELSEHHPT